MQKSILKYSLFLLVAVGFTYMLSCSSPERPKTLFEKGVEDFNRRLNAVDTISDYVPSQSINFNHSKHAGDLEIDCKYCHKGQEQSLDDLKPGGAVCINCHTE
jgi:hypothetical protein